jgi:hypothetical protein
MALEWGSPLYERSGRPHENAHILRQESKLRGAVFLRWGSFRSYGWLARELGEMMLIMASLWTSCAITDQSKPR